ncbi:S8 family serine peptidase [Actinoplanes sp. NPDC024001]|uniref:S8 family serine peptidase n=1 Tax=Actinoplanes sp. NPDC024001 TaxID=3154598 RepID=UPI0033DF8FDE
MKRGIFAGALAALAIAGVSAYALPTGTAEWAPVTYGLTANPETVVPAVVSPAQPARVVTTTLDADGRPVVTVAEATDRAGATGLVREAQRDRNTVGVEIDAVVKTLGETDRYRSLQWDMDTLRVPAAWQRSTGAGVTVAVIDTGVDAAHEDLAGRVLPGYDAIAGTAGVSTDENGHGTHVAGTVAASTGNGIGISAVAPDASILPVKVMGRNGSGYMSDVAEGIVWAVDHGARVINMSLGSSGQTGTVSTAIGYARSKNVVVVAAAGNSRAAGSPVNYPAADEGVIAVAATDSADAVASYSNAGGYVDVAAPGSGIVSTYPTARHAPGYGRLSGTSMAAPHVAAVAALLVAQRPGITPDEVESVLKTSAVDLGSAGRDDDYGYGRIDAAAALEAAAPAVEPTTAAPTTEPTMPSPEPTTPSAEPTMPSPEPTTPSAEPTSPSPEPTSASPEPSASETPAPAPVRIAITADVATQRVTYGTEAATTFTVAGDEAAWADKPASICVAPAGEAWTCAPVRTTVDGTYTDTRTATGAFRVRLVVTAGDANTGASATATRTVKAAATVTRVAKGTLAVQVTGAAGQTMTLQRYAAGQWTAVETFPTEAERTITGLAGGATYRIVVAGTATVQGVTSGSVRA